MRSHPEFNEWPKDCRELTDPAEIAENLDRHFLHHEPSSMEHRQAIVPESCRWGKGRSRDLRIFWWDETRTEGLMLAVSRNDTCVPEQHWFHVGCDHDWKELGRSECDEAGIMHCGNCWHVYRCRHCGKIMSQDSSG